MDAEVLSAHDFQCICQKVLRIDDVADYADFQLLLSPVIRI